MQQSALEHAALIWIRPSNTIRARGTQMAASEAGYMSAPDDAPKSALKIPLAQGAVIHVAHNAHDALGDVEATIHIARQIAQRAPALWAELLANRDKAGVQARLKAFQPMALIERFGGGLPRATLGCFCGYSASNPNQAAFFDLEAADSAVFLTADDATLFAAVDATPVAPRTHDAPDALVADGRRELVSGAAAAAWSGQQERCGGGSADPRLSLGLAERQVRFAAGVRSPAAAPDP